MRLNEKRASKAESWNRWARNARALSYVHVTEDEALRGKLFHFALVLKIKAVLYSYVLLCVIVPEC